MISSKFVIQAENIGKCYRLGLKENIQDNLFGTILEFIKKPFTNYRRYRSLTRFEGMESGSCQPEGRDCSDIIWALQDVSFKVKQGEVLGVIGGNGAGKSTLLKILSRITDPTRGHAQIRGRVASLLEVGTGFHPELTGRENVYLNGTILGMTKKEVDSKFDEIVDFSEIEKFLDTPVKRYSSGMRVRLAFAVAAHLEPEILLVDEVLAVGDSQFQRKCIGKMSNVAKEGRTILFVSHNMGAVTELCSRTIWLDGGVLKLDGPSGDVVAEYISSGAGGAGLWYANPIEEHPGRPALLKHARILSGNGDRATALFGYNDPIKVEIGYEIRESIKEFKSYLLLRDASGHIIWASHDTDGNYDVDHTREPGDYLSTCQFPERLLRPGDYYVTIGINGKPRETVEEEYLDALRFQISGEDYIFNHDKRKGIFTPFMPWDITPRQYHKKVGSIRS